MKNKSSKIDKIFKISMILSAMCILIVMFILIALWTLVHMFGARGSFSSFALYILGQDIVLVYILIPSVIVFISTLTYTYTNKKRRK